MQSDNASYSFMLPSKAPTKAKAFKQHGQIWPHVQVAAPAHVE